MGGAVLRLAAEDPRFIVSAAISGRSANAPIHAPVVLTADRIEQAPEFDCALDFSLSAGFDGILALCLARGKALVSGTTGLSVAQQDALQAVGTGIPILWAANFSLGVVVLTELVRRAAAALPDWDCDIVEAHHKQKLDAPSGTALQLGRAVEEGRPRAPEYASLRAGDIVGEHSVLLTGIGERLELIHRATSRDIFARGALEAVARLNGKPAARYRLADLLLD
jgi:4-hydroxy-tetrahydrodipicolinate reductase